MQTLWQDLRYGARTLLKKPGFALIAVVMLSLGIGANTAIFSVVNAVLLRPLPFNEPERLVALKSFDARRNLARGNVSYPDFADWRAQSQSFERMAVFRTTGFALMSGGEPARLRGAMVSADLFALLGVTPSLGRNFRGEEDQAGAQVVILSHNLWRQRFNSDPQVIGRKVRLDEQSYTVIGVAPVGFQFPMEAEPVELWTTMAADFSAPGGGKPLATQRGLHYLEAIGRLKPGITLAAAQAEMGAIARRLEQQYPEDNSNRGLRLVSALDELVGDVCRPLLTLFGAVGCVLLIACANVANLSLARATARRREIAIRLALGASRGRVIRQLLTESLLLALISGACGWLLAQWGADLLIALSPENIPRLQDFRIDSRAFGFTTLVSMLTGALFGLAPALQISKTELTEALKEGGRVASDGARRVGLRGALIVIEVAVALTLMIGAGLLLSSFWRLSQVDLGFDPRQALTLRVNLPDRYTDPQAVAFYEQLQTRLRALPGVRAASASFGLPLAKNHIGTEFEIEGRPVTPGERPGVDCQIVIPEYFNALGIQLLKGRDFTSRDDSRSRPVVIINEALARRYFPNEDPLGKRIRLDVATGSNDPQMTEIIGVVGNVRYRGLVAEPRLDAYIPYAQFTFTGGLGITMRADADSRLLAAAARAEIRALEKEAVVFDVKTLDQYVGAAIAQPRFNGMLLTVFAGAALFLTAIGLYSVMSYAVTQRTHEIGVRMALGAQLYDVLRLVVRQGMNLAMIGVALGLIASLGLARLMKTLLFGVSPTDPLTFIALSLTLLFVAFLACYLPARRAAKVDPLTALRCE
jgi:putative ABC transport system permease protein